jgi:hypothetical protein
MCQSKVGLRKLDGGVRIHIWCTPGPRFIRSQAVANSLNQAGSFTSVIGTDGRSVIPVKTSGPEVQPRPEDLL